MTLVEKLELALKLMKERKHDVSGLGGPMILIKEVIEEVNGQPCEHKNSRGYNQVYSICVDCGALFE